MEKLNENSLNGSNVFITGATGFIGSHLTIALNAIGANVVILKRDYVKDSLLETTGEIRNVNVAHGELEDLDSLMRVIAEYEIDTVFHMGAQAIETTSKINPRKTFESNIKGTWNILEACRLLNYESSRVERIIVATSDKSYGPAEMPYTEEMPLRGETPYDVSKSCADIIAQSYFKTYNLPVCISRLGNVYGPGDLNFNRIIPGTIKAITENKDITIRSDGKCVREYFYVKDAANSYIELAKNMSRKEIIGNAFNFSSGEQMTVLEVVNKIKKAMKSDSAIKILNTAGNEIKTQTLSTGKARRMLNWKPSCTFEESLPETIGWYARFLSHQKVLV